MDLAERQKVYDLLSRYFPNAKQLKDKKTLTAWGFALEHFTYRDVKNAVINYAISNKYFPDLADITAGLAPADTAPAAMPAHLDKNASLQSRWVRLYRQQLQEELDKRCLPDFQGGTGEEYRRWVAACLDAGLDVLALCEQAYQAAVAAMEVTG